MKRLAFFAALLLLIQCTDNMEDSSATSGPFESVLLSNFTGHLIRQSREKCGDGINVEFVIITEQATDTYFYYPDTYHTIPLKLQRGEDVRIKAYEIQDNGLRVFLTEKVAKFDPPNESTSNAHPEIVLCPKDEINIYDFQ